MDGYFDIHCHILPGVDDGAKDMEEALRMVFKAHEDGSRIITATPHYLAGRENSSSEKLLNLTDELNQEAKKAGRDILIILGNELMYSTDLITHLNRKDALTIDGTRYVLVEFMPDTPFREIREGLNHCIYAGYIPILAHVERYPCLLKEVEKISELVKLGAYIQINASCVTGGITDPRTNFGHRLIKKGWVHFIGSDAHGYKERSPSLKNAALVLKKKYGVDLVRQLLWENPMTMLEDRFL